MARRRYTDRAATGADTPLLAARFVVPAPPPGLVGRPRLLERMRRAADSRLTLLSAPAGAGKTVLASSWATEAVQGGRLTLAWLTLDDGDERPGVFWAYVIEGLARAGVDVAGVGVPGRADSLDRTLLNRLAQSLALHRQPVVLVVDSADLPGDPLPGADIDYLVRSAGGNLRLVLLTRSDPLLSLHRYRLAGTMTELRLDDLRFDVAEAHTLMRVADVDLPEQQVEALVARTGGWAAGLKFAAIAAAGQDHPEQALADFTGNNASVSDYLAREVLDTQPPDLREVLLRTSIVDELPPGLCDRLTDRPDGGRALELLAHGNSFVQRLSGVYRYQSLFRDFLRAQLAYEQPEVVPDLQLAAADWYARHGQLARAVRHAAAAGDWERAAEYVVDDLSIAALVVGVEDAGLSASFDALPEDVQGFATSLVRAALAVAHRDPAACSQALKAARAHVGHEPSASAQRLFSLELLELVGSALACEGAAEPDVETGLARAQAVEQRLFTDFPVPAAARPEIGVLVHLCAGRLHLWAGELDRAETVLSSAAESAREPRCRMIRLQCLDLAALVAAVGGRLRRSTASLALADVEARHGGIDPDHRSAAAAVARAWVATDELRLSEAGAFVLDAEAASTGRSLLTTTLLGLVRARLLRARGDLGEARYQVVSIREAARRTPDWSGLPGWLEGLLVATAADLEVAAGHPDEAVDLIGAAGLVCRETVLALDLALMARDGAGAVDGGAGLPETAGQPSASLNQRIAAGMVEVVRSITTDDLPAARSTLEATLRLAAPERLRRPFVEAPSAVRRQLRTGRLPDRHGWLGDQVIIPRQRERPGQDTAAPSPVRTVAGDLVVEPLTAKELEVLAHLAELLPTDEIAATMFISVNTVRTHVRNILRKLGAGRRNEAVRLAWELDLIPAPAPAMAATGPVP